MKYKIEAVRFAGTLVFLSASAAYCGTSPAVSATPTTLEKCVLASAQRDVIRTFIGSIVDASSSVRLNRIETKGACKIRGVEIIFTAGSQSDYVYLEQDRGLAFLKAMRLEIDDLPRFQASTQNGWTLTEATMLGDALVEHIPGAGWYLWKGHVGTMIQGFPAFHCPLPKTPLPDFINLVAAGLSKDKDRADGDDGMK